MMDLLIVANFILVIEGLGNPLSCQFWMI